MSERGASTLEREITDVVVRELNERGATAPEALCIVAKVYARMIVAYAAVADCERERVLTGAIIVLRQAAADIHCVH